MGPVWDFNLAWNNADYCDNDLPGGWAYQYTNTCESDVPFWWRRLNQDSVFVNNTRCRWEELRVTVFDTLHIFNYIDSIAGHLNESQNRQYFTYPILGVYIWPNTAPVATTYPGEIANLKKWIRDRVVFMDQNLPGNCIERDHEEDPDQTDIHLFPNPSINEVSFINQKSGKLSIAIYDAVGRKVVELNTEGKGKIAVDVRNFSKGIYVLRLVRGNGEIAVGKFVKN